jgi:hypothetical protein
MKCFSFLFIFQLSIKSCGGSHLLLASKTRNEEPVVAHSSSRRVQDDSSLTCPPRNVFLGICQFDEFCQKNDKSTYECSQGGKIEESCIYSPNQGPNYQPYNSTLYHDTKDKCFQTFNNTVSFVSFEDGSKHVILENITVQLTRPEMDTFVEIQYSVPTNIVNDDKYNWTYQSPTSYFDGHTTCKATIGHDQCICTMCPAGSVTDRLVDCSNIGLSLVKECDTAPEDSLAAILDALQKHLLQAKENSLPSSLPTSAPIATSSAITKTGVDAVKITMLLAASYATAWL